jgi:DNA-binding transcriptional LysR family regulator
LNNLNPEFYYKRNRLQQLKGFYCTAKNKSPALAAKEMNLSRSTITMQITSLERDLSTKLFHHKKGNFTLTKDGAELYDMSAPLINGIDNLYEKFLSNKSKDKSQTINIATHHIAISFLLPKYISEFNKTHKHIKLNIKNISSDEAESRLINNEIDLTIYPTSETGSEFYSKPHSSYEPILLMRRDHPLASKTKKTIQLEDISKHTLVRIDPGLITLPLFEEAVKKHKIGSNISLENGNWEMLKHFVRNEIGLAVVSTICLNENDPILMGIELTKFFPKMTYGITIKKGKYINENIKHFIELMDKNYFPENKNMIL